MHTLLNFNLGAEKLLVSHLHVPHLEHLNFPLHMTNVTAEPRVVFRISTILLVTNYLRRNIINLKWIACIVSHLHLIVHTNIGEAIYLS